MSIDSYHREKFNSAIYCLASPESMNRRLFTAFLSMVTVDPEQFTDPELGGRYRELLTRVNSAPEEFEGQGTLQATLNTMSDEKMYDVAKEIISIHNELMYAIKPN